MALTLVTSDLIGGLDYSKLTGTVPTWNQNTTGSAATLTTARNIGGVSFNGSAAINLPGVNAAGNQNTSGTAAGLSATLVVGSGGTGVTSITALKNVLDDETWTFANDTTFSGNVSLADTKYIQLNNTSTDWRLRADNAGRFVVQTTSGSEQFKVGGSSLIEVGSGTGNNTFLVTKSSAGWYSGIKLTRGLGDGSSTGNNNFGMLVTDNGWEVATFTSPSNNVTGRSPKLTISSAGLTQINSTSTTALELITNQSASSLRLKNTGSVVSDWIMQSGGLTAGDLSFYNLDTSAYRLTITSGGNLGIGTTSTEGKLTINYTAANLPTSGTTSNSAIQILSSLNNQLNIGLNVAPGYGSYIQASDNNLAVPYSLNLQPSGGNVGIGTSSPSALLHVFGDAGSSANAALRIRGTNTTARTTRLQLEDYSGAIADALIDFVIPNAGSSSGSYLGMGVNSTTQLVCSVSGYVGIGTTSPSTKLDVQGATGTRNYNTTSGQSSGIYETSRYYSAAGNATTNVAIVTTTAFPTIGGGGYIMVEVSASGYGSGGSNGLVFSWIGGGYGGHFGTPGSLSYHPVQIIADTHHSSCNVSVYYPNYNNVGITIVNSSGTGMAGVMRVKVTTTY